MCVQKRRLQRSVLRRLNAQWVIKRSGSGEVLRTEGWGAKVHGGAGKGDGAGWNMRTESGSTQGKLDYWMLCKDAAVEMR